MTKTKQQQHQSKKQNNSSTPPTELTFLDHVHELRKRVFWVILVLVITSAAGLQMKDQLIAAVMEPLHGQKLIYLTPGGGFSFIFTVSLYFGALLTIPFAVYHLYKFLKPLMKKVSRRFVASFIFLSCLLAAAGAAFGYFVTIPAALNFLATFAGDAVTPNLTADSYLSFVTTYVLGLAVLFQLPLLLFLMDHIHPFPPGSLGSSQRFVIIAATVIAALITPTPDAFNMAIVAVPIVLIYEIGVVAVFIRHRVMRSSTQRTKVNNIVEEPPLQSEPLTAMVEELASRHTPAPTQKQALPQSRLAQPVLRTYRTMDGVIVTRTAPNGVTIPARSEASIQRSTPPSRVVNTRPLRSIDGFSMGMG